MKNTVQSPKFCLSLRRFSSDAQTGNSSLTRQADIAKAIADRNGWVLREDWSITQEAVSAYKKHNFPALLALIDAVKKGVIPVGTVVVCEAIDRISRALLDEGREMIRQMLLAGLEICDNEGNHYTKADLNDIVKLLTLCLKLVAANEYAARLSSRVKEAYRIRSSRISKGEKLMINKDGIARKDCPSWITCTGNGFELNGKAEIIASMFTDYLNNIGAASIARKLNSNQVSTFSGEGTWSQSFVYRILADRRVIGEIKANGETVTGYYPSVIAEETFLKAQAKREDNRGVRPVGKALTGYVANLFGGVSYCDCGSKLKVTSGKNGRYLTCYGKLNGSTNCKAPMTKYAPFEGVVLNILKLNPSQLLTDENGEGVNGHMQILKGRKAEVEKKLNNITEALTIAMNKALVIKQAELQTQVEEIESQIAIEGAKTVANKGSIERLTAILESLYEITTSNEARIKVNAWFIQNVNRVVFNREAKTIQVDLKNGNLISMDINGTILGTKSLTAMFGLSKNVTVNTDNVVAPESVNWTIDSETVAKAIKAA
jgi:DNA invertase Pin-like site-specific DNA recombinase